MISAIKLRPQDPEGSGTAGTGAARKGRGIVIQLVGVGGREDLLAETPHVAFEDMAAVFRLVLSEGSGEEEGLTSLLVTGEVAAGIGKSAEELYEEALSQLPSRCPAELLLLRDVIEREGGLALPDDARSVPMLAVTTEKRVYGASVILYPGVLEEVSERLGGSFFALPSSVHEFIALPDDGSACAEELGKMVFDINRKVVAPEERLTDSVYRYDAEKRSFRRVWPEPGGGPSSA